MDIRICDLGFGGWERTAVCGSYCMYVKSPTSRFYAMD